MIEIEGVSHGYAATPVLRDVSLRLAKGGITALIGPNGAGKSTLLSLAARLLPLRTGRIAVDGLDVARTPSRDLALKIAVLRQETALGTRVTVRDLVGFGRYPHCQGRPGPDDRAAVEEAIAQFDLGPLSQRFLDELSGGQRQRAHLAMTFAQGTDWLLLDEPLNNLDMAHSRALMARLADLVRGSARSVVTVVHEVNYAAAWADHVVAMKNGRVVAQGAPEAVLTEPVLSALYDTPVEVMRHDDRPLVLHHHWHDQLSLPLSAQTDTDRPTLH